MWSLGLIIAEMLCGWFIKDCPGHENFDPCQNPEMRKFIIREVKKKDKVLGNLVSKMLQPKVTTRWTSEKLVKELEKIGLKEVKGRIVDTGFAPQVSKEWIDRLLKRPVKPFKDAIARIPASFVSGQGRAVTVAKSKPVEKRKGLQLKLRELLL